uniref:Uncharacterized protein n=1 Tax=Noctiluca scintillans TaxID=2966 RepID=A0A7S1EXJ3_NOCSC|mmetsp:Transcript_1497/g.4099  ORF Transcript_1497/g.4099 Transcript_1497/m.4099 type:complete len:210 (+) Transcript_1497:167-796(+)|eukprot:CAMPEP_0194523146 /NCGR_PEP_ID=MMETSP0253-20130528/57968_1 /TAXON_ID=2966 /ORGANISM="Noctiluca scintillans" /LENGTH=209 /DNA_ID=CAMNT_0039367649 /DNA_START=76 /DNA_END=705 /DNA_ORIENTATION=-
MQPLRDIDGDGALPLHVRPLIARRPNSKPYAASSKVPHIDVLRTCVRNVLPILDFSRVTLREIRRTMEGDLELAEGTLDVVKKTLRLVVMDELPAIIRSPKYDVTQVHGALRESALTKRRKSKKNSSKLRKGRVAPMSRSEFLQLPPLKVTIFGTSLSLQPMRGALHVFFTGSQKVDIFLDNRIVSVQCNVVCRVPGSQHWLEYPLGTP